MARRGVYACSLFDWYECYLLSKEPLSNQGITIDMLYQLISMLYSSGLFTRTETAIRSSSYAALPNGDNGERYSSRHSISAFSWAPGLFLAGIFAIIGMKFAFGISILKTLLALALTFPLSLVAIQATGATGTAPFGTRVLSSSDPLPECRYHTLDGSIDSVANYFEYQPRQFRTRSNPAAATQSPRRRLGQHECKPSLRYASFPHRGLISWHWANKLTGRLDGRLSRRISSSNPCRNSISRSSNWDAIRLSCSSDAF